MGLRRKGVILVLASLPFQTTVVLEIFKEILNRILDRNLLNSLSFFLQHLTHSFSLFPFLLAIFMDFSMYIDDFTNTWATEMHIVF